MEVKKLYYENCHQRTFTARVTGCREGKGGWEVTLDQTAFYPEGGGQPSDTGTLGEARVLSVQEAGEEILHLCDAPLIPGAEVTGTIDWERRFDLMQQHSGEHLVSGVIHRRYGYHNVGFHMGEDRITIDFDGPIPPEDLPDIQQEVNAAIWKNLPVKCWYPTPEELPRVTYRSKKALPWPVRIVEVPGVDSCACCGTHVAFTGEIGLVVLLSSVKFHQGVRMELLCGGRAVLYLCRIYEQNKQVSQAFSAKLLETGEAARRMNRQLEEARFRANGLQLQVFAAIAREYQGESSVLYFAENLEPGQVRQLCEVLGKTCPRAAVASGEEGAGYSLCLTAQPEVTTALGKALKENLGARGGGKPGWYQGNVPAGKEEIAAFFRREGWKVAP